MFEHHAGAKPIDAVVSATKARQAASHIDWMRTNVPAVKDADILSVLVTPATKATKGAAPSLHKVALWPLDDFRVWARKALAVMRELRTAFSEPGDLDWRIRAAEAFEANGMDAPSLHERLASHKASEILELID